MAPDIMIVIIADKVDDDKLLEKNIDEVISISPENLADKILNMLAKRELKRLKERPDIPQNISN